MDSRPDWIKKLPTGISNLSFEELRNFKEFDQYLTGSVNGPKGWTYFIKCFRSLTVFSLFSIYENHYPALTKCWNDLEKTFLNDDIFDDGVFVQSWIFCDFPCDDAGKTALDHFEIFVQGDKHFTAFIQEMKRSRLGVYQEIMSSSKTTKFRELITGSVISAFRNVLEYEKGEIFLTRLVEYKGKTYQLVDPKCWPKQYKPNVEGFIDDKMNYFDGPSDKERYHKLMKLGGPYWMSCVTTDDSCPILPPDHYQKYYD